MSEIFWSWPWYDRLIVGIVVIVLVSGTIFIQQRLDRIIKLLERANELEWEKQMRRERPDLFD